MVGIIDIDWCDAMKCEWLIADTQIYCLDKQNMLDVDQTQPQSMFYINVIIKLSFSSSDTKIHN
jgi:hypothetical protein